MSVDPVRWGILSTAHINEKVLVGAGGTPTVDVVAVGSRSAERSREFVEQGFTGGPGGMFGRFPGHGPRPGDGRGPGSPESPESPAPSPSASTSSFGA